MHTFFVLSATMLFMIPFSLAAPALDSSTLLSNGNTAISLNSIFSTFNASDSCSNGDVACIYGSTASCVTSRWNLTNCPNGNQCFVLPLLRTEGTFIECTSQKNAQSVITATGATADSGNESNTDSASNPQSSSSLAPQSVTVTATPTAFSTVVTTTVSPDAISSLLASLSADSGEFPIVTVVTGGMSAEATAV